MTTPVDLFIRRELIKLGRDAGQAISRLKSATTLRQVRDFGRIQISGPASSLRHMVPEIGRLASERGRRAKQLVDAQLFELKALLDAGDIDEFEKKMIWLKEHEWPFLRGDHAGLLRMTEVEVVKMQHKNSC